MKKWSCPIRNKDRRKEKRIERGKVRQEIEKICTGKSMEAEEKNRDTCNGKRRC